MSSKKEDPSQTLSKIRIRGISEETAIYNTFMLVIRNKFVATPESPSHEGESKIRRLDELYSSSSSYQAEKKKITEINNNGMAKGLAVGLCSFMFLRGGPRSLTRVLSRSRSTSGGYQFDVRSPSKQITQEPDPAIPRPGIFMRTLKFGLDAFVSLSLAAYGSAYFTDTNKLMNDLADIPLVEGRSLISDELCDDFIDTYKSIPKRTWDKYDGKSEPLDAIGKFVRNCLRRHALEKRIIEEKRGFRSFGIDSKFKQVEIPYPGVPRDMDVEVPWVDKSEDLKNERDDNQFEDEFDWNGFENSEQQSDKNERGWK